MSPKNSSIVKMLFSRKILTTVFFLATLVLAFVAPFKSYIMQWLIDAGSKRETLYMLCCGIGVVLLSHGAEYVSRQSFAKLASKSIEDIRCQIVERQLHKPMSTYLQENTGDILSGLTNDMRVIQDDYYMSIFSILFWGGMGIVALGMLASIAPAMLICVVIFAALPMLVPKLMSNQLRGIRESYTSDTASYTGRTAELLKGYEAMLTAGALGYFRQAHSHAAESNRRTGYALQRKLNVAMTASSLLAWIPNLSILLVGVFLVYDGKISIGYLVTAHTLSSFVLNPFNLVSNAYAKLKAASAVRTKIESMMAEAAPEKGGLPILKAETIQLKDVTFTYPGRECPALRQMSLSLQKEKKTALVGESGCGKSTVLKLLFKYYEANQGQILVDGKELEGIDRNSLYQRIAMIPQAPFLFNDSIYNNICLGKEASEADVQEAIRLSGLSDFVREQPEGWDTLIAENGRNLSGGQAQRIAIARAILRRCDFLLVDEATSSLDVSTTYEIMQNLLQLDCGVVIVTHDIFGDYMNRFDTIYLLEQGAVAEQGTFSELIQLGGCFGKWYDRADLPVEDL